MPKVEAAAKPSAQADEEAAAAVVSAAQLEAAAAAAAAADVEATVLAKVARPATWPGSGGRGAWLGGGPNTILNE